MLSSKEANLLINAAYKAKSEHFDVLFMQISSQPPPFTPPYSDICWPELQQGALNRFKQLLGLLIAPFLILILVLLSPAGYFEHRRQVSKTKALYKSQAGHYRFLRDSALENQEWDTLHALWKHCGMDESYGSKAQITLLEKWLENIPGLEMHAGNLSARHDEIQSEHAVSSRDFDGCMLFPPAFDFVLEEVSNSLLNKVQTSG